MTVPNAYVNAPKRTGKTSRAEIGLSIPPSSQAPTAMNTRVVIDQMKKNVSLLFVLSAQVPSGTNIPSQHATPLASTAKRAPR